MYHGGQWWIEDLASRNGTELNGIPVDEPLVVSYGDTIQLGRVATRLEPGSGQEEPVEMKTVSHVEE
jgi:pSer/pThr/pTyr-binding forkhead associated (FHA) protein